jgi:hypothetical protein
MTEIKPAPVSTGCERAEHQAHRVGRVTRNKSQQNQSTCCGEIVSTSKAAEIFVERENDALLMRRDRHDFLVWRPLATSRTIFTS